MDAEGQNGVFLIKVNKETIYLSHPETKEHPNGAPVMFISRETQGFEGVIDQVSITNNTLQVAVLELNDITYEDGKATTPDTSGKGNDGTVFGARLVPSNAPIQLNSQGDVYVDSETGIRTHYGLLEFVEASASPSLLNSAEGLLHLYYAGLENPPGQELPSGFNVVQLDLNSRRAAYITGWQAGKGDARQTGQYQFLAQRAGTAMNAAEITVTTLDAENTAGLCNITFKMPNQPEETWKGVPSSINDVSAILAGNYAFSPQDAGVLAGSKVFFDVYGDYSQVRLALDLEEKFAVLNFVTRFPSLLPLAHVEIKPNEENQENRDVTLTFNPQKNDWPDDNLVETWEAVPAQVLGFIDTLNGIEITDALAEDFFINKELLYLVSESQSPGNTVSFFIHSTLQRLTITVQEGSNATVCKVSLAARIGRRRKHAELTSVPRELGQFAEVLGGNDAEYDYDSLASGEYQEMLSLLLPIAAGSQGSIQNGEAKTPSPKDRVKIAASLFAIFQSGERALSAIVPEEFEADAEVLQSGQDTQEQVLERGSQIFQGVAQDLPTNGAVALLQDTGSRTDETADLIVQGANGGWIKPPPQHGLNFSGKQYVNYDVNATHIDTLSFSKDMTLETWVKPKAPDDPRFIQKPQRLLTFNKTGRPGKPDAPSQYAIGFEPSSYGFEFTYDCRIISPNFVDSVKQENFSLELWFYPTDETKAGRLATYVTQTKDNGPETRPLEIDYAHERIFVYSYGTGVIRAVTQPLPINQWINIVVTMDSIPEEKTIIRDLRLYLNGVLHDSKKFDSNYDPAPILNEHLRLGSWGGNDSVEGVRVGSASFWTKVLMPEEIAHSFMTPLPDLSDDLLLRWKFFAGSGTNIQNYSSRGAELNGTVYDPYTWFVGGVYNRCYVANADLAVNVELTDTLNFDRWNHIAASSKRGTALGFAEGSFASTAPNDMLNINDNATLEVWIQPENVDGTQTIFERQGNFAANLVAGVFNFTFYTTAGPISLNSDPDKALKAGDVGYFTVVFQSNVNPPPEKVTSDMTHSPLVNEPVQKPKYYVKATLYKNGVAQSQPYAPPPLDDPVYVINAKTGLRLGQDSNGSNPYTGALTHLRLWNPELAPVEIADVYKFRSAPTNTDGLIVAWNFGEMEGRTAYDQSRTLPMVLSDDNMWQYFDAVSTLLLMINGHAINPWTSDGQVISYLERVSVAEVGGYDKEQFRIGNPANAKDVPGLYAEIDEVRLWNIARTHEQITDEMYRSLSGAETGLAGYWRFDTGSGMEVVDATGNGNDGKLGADDNQPLPSWVPSQAPISNEAGAVYNALSNREPTEFNEPIVGVPAVIEYADLQTDAYGTIFSVMKRCYAASVPNGSLQLITGYKVGDLDTVLVGQVQTEPKIIGYFEGAPPIPSENQTMPVWAGDITEYHTYASATTVSLDIQQDVTYTITGTFDSGRQQSIGGQIGLYFLAGAAISFGLGVQNENELFDASVKGGFASTYDWSNTSSQGVAQSFTTTKNQTSTFTPGGYWEPDDQILNPTVGRRYIPKNLGTAVVKSRVADLYALRIKSTAQLVKLSIRPNPDIPEDVNLIDFPINPQYIKNGTLDGQVGLVKDPDTGVSYFQPLEAYALKRQIEREQQQIEAYFAQINVSSITDNNFDDLANNKLPSNPSYDWSANLSMRGIVNTYVWTAGGGTHADTVNFADMYSENWGSIRHSNLGLGLHFEYQHALIIGPYVELDYMNNTTIEVVSSKTKDRSNTVSLESAATPDWFLSAPDVNEEDETITYSKAPAPGKVDGYRYMAFYLPPTQQNVEFFTNRLIDPVWIRQSQTPSAAALRQALMADNGSWRVLYRVTYVSRIPPDFQASPELIQAPALIPPANLEQNTVFTWLVSKQVSNPVPTNIGQALQNLLGVNQENPGMLREMLLWWPDFLKLAEDYSQPQSVTLSQLRTDSLQYMLAGYESDEIAAETNVRLIGKR